MCIANNLVFDEKLKHIEVGCHFIQDIVMAKRNITSYVTSGVQLADIFTKALFRKLFSNLYNKLGMTEIYAPIRGGVLECVARKGLL